MFLARRFTISVLRASSVSPQYVFSYASSKMTSNTSSTFQTSFEEGGVKSVGPKQASQLRDLKLNDGNEIPMVHC